MRTRDVLDEVKNSNMSNEAKKFITSKWESSLVNIDKKYGSKRCPCCNTVVQYVGHYCIQCGKKIICH